MGYVDSHPLKGCLNVLTELGDQEIFVRTVEMEVQLRYIATHEVA
jgi:hypothetical protein